MDYFFLFIIILIQLFERIFAKQYNIKAKAPNINLFTAVGCFCALLFFLINSGGSIRFPQELIPYSAAFSMAFGTASAAMIFAIKTGPLSITALITSYSLLIPTFYGILFLHDPIHPTLYIGLAALLISLYLINKNKDESMKFSPSWIIYILLTFIANGMCSTIQKMQQVHFDGAYKNEFMIISLAVVTIVLLVLGLSKKGNKREMLKPCIKYGAVKGLINGIMNYLVMVVSASMPNSVLFPSISAGGIVLTFICALTIYKEKLSKTQTVGYILGIVSVVFLNI